MSDLASGVDVDEMPTIRIELPIELKEFGQFVQDSISMIGLFYKSKWS